MAEEGILVRQFQSSNPRGQIFFCIFMEGSDVFHDSTVLF
jgi:hypothetical protein